MLSEMCSRLDGNRPTSAALTILVLCLLAPGFSTAALAQPSVTAVRVQQPPTLDGNVTSDPAWREALPASGFLQEQPDEGRPSSERTEVRIVYRTSTKKRSWYS